VKIDLDQPGQSKQDFRSLPAKSRQLYLPPAAGAVAGRREYWVIGIRKSVFGNRKSVFVSG
jgi:hypothetical protein